ncbi:hypothetical protein ES708_15539 [subsurface metagenome]
MNIITGKARVIVISPISKLRKTVIYPNFLNLSLEMGRVSYHLKASPDIMAAILNIPNIVKYNNCIIKNAPKRILPGIKTESAEIRGLPRALLAAP